MTLPDYLGSSTASTQVPKEAASSYAASAKSMPDKTNKRKDFSAGLITVMNISHNWGLLKKRTERWIRWLPHTRAEAA